MDLAFRAIISYQSKDRIDKGELSVTIYATSVSLAITKAHAEVRRLNKLSIDLKYTLEDVQEIESR